MNKQPAALIDIKERVSFAGVYVHLPFCHSICPFCSFPVLKNQKQRRINYLNSLLAEIKLWQAKFPSALAGCTSLYIGGGTPSCYSAPAIASIKQALQLPTKINFSLEVNPEDCSSGYLEDLKQIGVNRISLGLQSFSDRHLKILGRSHSANQNFLALKALKTARITNFNLDLLYGYPQQSLADLKRDLTEFLAANPPHLSAYGLTLEPKTPAFKSQKWRSWLRINEALFVKQFQLINANLSKVGLNRYELSNFAKPEFESPQNLIYWRQKHFLGIGLGAFSRCQRWRFSNQAKLKDWQESIASNRLPIQESTIMSDRQILDEYLTVALRSSQGLNFDRLSQLWPKIDWPCFLKQNLQFWLKTKRMLLSDDGLLLTETGLMLADEVTLSISHLIDQH